MWADIFTKKNIFAKHISRRYVPFELSPIILALRRPLGTSLIISVIYNTNGSLSLSRCIISNVLESP